MLSQIDQQVVGAPSKSSGFTSLANTVKQLSNICDMQPDCVSLQAKMSCVPNCSWNSAFKK